MNTGPLTHHLMKARELTEGQPELEVALFAIDCALLVVRQVHHRGQ